MMMTLTMMIMPMMEPRTDASKPLRFIAQVEAADQEHGDEHRGPRFGCFQMSTQAQVEPDPLRALRNFNHMTMDFCGISEGFQNS